MLKANRLIILMASKCINQRRQMLVSLAVRIEKSRNASFEVLIMSYPIQDY